MGKNLWKLFCVWILTVCMAGSLLPVQLLSAQEYSGDLTQTGQKMEDAVIGIEDRNTKAGEAIKVACVGDSLTYGYLSSSPATKSYPARLQELLGDGYVVENFGRNSATLLNGTDMAYTDQAQYQASLQSNPDIVIIMLGTNDSKAKYWEQGGRERFAADAKALVQTYQNLPSNPEVIFATSPACFFLSANDIRGNIIETEIVPMQRQLAEENGWKTIDMYGLTADRDFFYNADGVHLSDTGYYYEAECMYFAVTGEKVAEEGLLLNGIQSLSEQPGNEAGYAVDDDYSTIWHSAWEPASVREDHVLILELKERSLVDGVSCLPRQNGTTNGIITAYEIQLSNDGGRSYTKVTEGSWEENRLWKHAEFPGMAATHVKLVVKDALPRQGGGGPHASAAEVRVNGSEYAADTVDTARENLQNDYSSALSNYTDASLYQKESWEAFQAKMKAAEELLKKEGLTLEEADTAGKELRQAVLNLKKTVAEPVEASKVMARKYYVAKDGTVLPYRIYLPEGYSAEKKYPLVLFLHGADKRGSDNKAQLESAYGAFFERILGAERNRYPAIIVAPQCPSEQQWVDTPWINGCYSLDSVEKSNEMEAVEELLEQLQNEYSVNRNRLYAVGVSMGGFGVWDLIMRNPDLLAAAIPMAGAGDPSKAALIKDMSIWCFHGETDTVVPFAQSTPRMVEALTNAGSEKMRYTEYSAEVLGNSDGHNIDRRVYAEPEFLSWLFAQKKEMEVSELSEAVLAAKKADTEKYTKESVKEFLDALSRAELLLNDDSAQQEDIDAALAALQQAAAGLKEKPEDVKDYPQPVEKEPGKEFGKEAPQLLSLARKSKKITVSWSKVKNAEGYEIYYNTGGAYRKAASVGGDTASYRMDKVKTRTVYAFRIRAYRVVDGKTYYSDYSEQSRKSIDIPKTKVTSVKRAGKALRIKWKKISGAFGYKITRKTGAKGKYRVIATIKKGKKTTFTDKKVKAGKKYYYKVRPFAKVDKKVINGSWSAIKAGKF